ncbi:T6SS phospholipase effector Tle1-like catalytic domain-containing protein [Methylovorus mays]|uniref:T6SS phospholipase effector Tle1-like catalytic domain-containing protein n=1 Tax=Methylovorus mays TaxID=184077 RepID=UPI001E3788C6|nr:DUF2235 domain-containing protein [Methylovorus mays]MCB5206624.1 DUF2235 domain-containing protein [Methylovorus mays]
MSAQSPNQFPTSGERKPSFDDMLQQAEAHAIANPNIGRLPKQCESQVYVGIFFDGTGNNMHLDFEVPPPEKRKHTNVVKLYQAFRDAKPEGYFPIYIPGIGTPFPEIGDTHNKDEFINTGAMFGDKGEHRILWAMIQLLNAPQRYVKRGNFPLLPDAEAKVWCDKLAPISVPSAMRVAQFKRWQFELQNTLYAYKPKITTLNVSVFGFSRGAAEARVFVNWLMEVCERTANGWLFGGIQLNVQFLGLFDTVASVGLANTMGDTTASGHMSWADNTLQIHPAVRRCVHMVAAHEVRASFPLDSARVHGQYPGNVQEIMYPGAHSDVGGGYAPGAIGVYPRMGDNLSVFAGQDMYHAARIAGVPMVLWDNLDPDIRKSLLPSNELIRAYNGYLNACGVSAGPVDEMHRQHMGLYHSYRYKWRNEFTTRKMAYRHARTAAEQQSLLKVQNRFLQAMAFGVTPPDKTGISPVAAAQLFERKHIELGLQMTAEGKQRMEVARYIQPERVTPEIDFLFDWFVHDSMAGALGDGLDEFKYNIMGAARFRRVFKGND